MALRFPTLLLPMAAMACGSDARLQSNAGAGVEGDAAGECSDGADNDLDGAFDCDDPGCSADDDCADDESDGPGAPGVGITPAAPTSAEDLHCSVTSASPGGADVDYTLTWAQNGIETGIEGPELASRETLRGDDWSCTVTPRRDGVVGTAGVATVSIGNAPPATPVVAIQPSAPLEQVDPLLCALIGDVADPDGDVPSLSVSWSQDGNQAPTGDTTTIPGDTLPAGQTLAGETWSCALTAEDGRGGASVGEASVRVASCDEDLDGHDSIGCGGGDCDDTRADVNPSMTEVCNNGVDDDCDGSPDPCRLSGELRATDAVAVRWGEDAYDYAGSAAAGGRDLDGDGREDWVSGAYAHTGVAANSGVAWVLSGPLTGSASLASATARIEGSEAGGFMGHTVDLVQDLSGDGLADVVVGASGVDADGRDEGAVYVYAGPVTGDHTVASATAWIVGDEPDGRVGAAVAEALDLDGAGTSGLLLGAYGLAGAGFERGGAYLLAGPLTGAVALSDAVATVQGESDGDRVGGNVSAGDVDGDGITDLLFGVDALDGGARDAGGMYVVMGPLSGDRDLADADEVLYGEQAGDNAGAGIEVVGDVNADGRDDVVVGARHADLSGSGALQGKAYLVLGPMTASDLYAAHAELRGEGGSDRTGGSLGRVGDVDGDGFDDVIVGAMSNNGNGEAAGAAFLLYGPMTGQVSLGAADARIRGERGQHLGTGLAGSDQDGDGHDDVMVGLFYDDTAAESAGALAVFPGGGL